MGRVYPHISQLLQEMAGQSRAVLELGCGAKQYGDHIPGAYYGIDLQTTYSTAADLGPDALANAEDLPFAAASMDLVFTVATLLIVPDTDKALAEAHRVLRPGGKLLVFDYSPWVARRLARNDSAHCHSFSSKSLARRLLEAGFSPHVHSDCVPIRGGAAGRLLLRDRRMRRLTYLISNWIVVSGTKKSDTKKTVP